MCNLQGLASPPIFEDSDWTAVDMPAPAAANADSSVFLRGLLDKFHVMAHQMEQNIRSNQIATKQVWKARSGVPSEAEDYVLVLVQAMCAALLLQKAGLNRYADQNIPARKCEFRQISKDVLHGCILHLRSMCSPWTLMQPAQSTKASVKWVNMPRLNKGSAQFSWLWSTDTCCT